MRKFLALSGGKDSMACLYLLRDELDGAIYIDTGFAYPETLAMIDHASTLVPVHRITSQRELNHQASGIPADVVPVEWTAIGQRFTRQKPYRIQSSFECCYANIGKPLLDASITLGVTHLVYGQREDDIHKAPIRDGEMMNGIVRVHPIEHWTTEDVLRYLSTKMEIPPHFQLAHSSLDCYDCTAFQRQSQDRVVWMKDRHPEYYAAYAAKANAVLDALEASL